VYSAVAAMAADKDVPEIETATHRSVVSLCQILKNFLLKEIELTRICRVAVLLRESGINPNATLYRRLTRKCINLERSDGGWTDVVETLWCTALLNTFDEFSDRVQSGLKWLRDQRHKDGGWGKSIRDVGRVPVTGLLLYLLPQLSSNEHLKWLENRWCQEWKVEPTLTYKAALTLMAFQHNNYHPENEELIVNTVHWLSGQQNDDGGWGPWKGHPVGSDPWCTGIAMMGLLRYPDKVAKDLLSKGLNWLKEKQLPNGLWPYHYIEEGSSWALYALVMGYSLLNGREID